MANVKHKGKNISVHEDGHIFVDGKDTKLKQWSCGNRYSNLNGQEDKNIKGKGLIEALYLKGFVPRPWEISLLYFKVQRIMLDFKFEYLSHHYWFWIIHKI